MIDWILIIVLGLPMQKWHTTIETIHYFPSQQSCLTAAKEVQDHLFQGNIFTAKPIIFCLERPQSSTVEKEKE